MTGRPAMMRPNDLCTAAFFGDVRKIKELVALPPVEEEPPLEDEFDPLAPPDEDAVAAAAERAAARASNEAALKRLLHAPGLLITRLSPVNVKRFGFFVDVEERELRCRARFKSSAGSEIPAAPLHWAVLGRELAAVELLVGLGADVNQRVPQLQVTVFDICAANELRETQKRLYHAIAAREAVEAATKAKDDARAAVVKQREAARVAALEEVRRKEEEEERLEAERLAREEEEEAAAAREAEGEEAAREEETE